MSTGDWHLAYNAAQAMAEHIWHGGLDEVAKVCGLPNITHNAKWKDLHPCLLTLWQALHRILMEKFLEHELAANDIQQPSDEAAPSNENGIGSADCSPPTSSRMKIWLQKVRDGSISSNKTVIFWARWLQLLDAYVALYVAIRNGDWHLRCAAIRALAPIFFALNKPKYQVLLGQAIMDFRILPHAVLTDFVENGSFTVSVKGRPGCNQALDEAHESIINLLLKKYVGRASVARLQELAGFLCCVVGALEASKAWLTHYDKKKENALRKSPEERNANVILDKWLRPLMNDEWACQDFGLRRGFGSSDDSAASAKLPAMDAAQVDDLMDFWQRGSERLRTHMQMHSFTPPLIRRTLKKFVKLKTFAPEVKKPRREAAATRQLVNVIKSYAKKLRKYTSLDPLSSLPAAIATPKGEIRRVDADLANDPEGEQRKGQKSRMAAVIEKQVGAETFSRCAPNSLLLHMKMPSPDAANSIE